MPRGRASTNEDTIRKMFILHGENVTPNKIAARLKIAPNTVRKHLADKDNIARYGDLMNEIEQMHSKSNMEVLELVKSVRYSEIANTIVDMLNPTNLEEERKERGLRNHINLLGNVIDKSIKLQNLDIRHKELEISLKQLELKEKEFNARMENPEAFAVVQIVNDAPMVDNNYGTN